MAKIKCAKCGRVFGIERGEIQSCPFCGCRMRIKLKNAEPTVRYDSQPSIKRSTRPSSGVSSSAASAKLRMDDEYENLRREYGRYRDLSRDGNPNGADTGNVTIPRAEYDELIFKAKSYEATANGTTVAQSQQPIQPKVQPTVQPAVIQPVVQQPAVQQPVVQQPAVQQPVVQQSVQQMPPVFTTVQQQPAPVQQPAPQQEPVAPVWNEPAPQSVETSVPQEEEEDVPAKPKKKGTVVNWLALGVALVAAILSACLLVLPLDPLGLTNGLAWMLSSFFAVPFNIPVAVILFLPAVLALITLIGSIRRGKGIKIVMGVLFIVSAVLTLYMPNLVGLFNALAAGGEIAFPGVLIPSLEAIWMLISAIVNLCAGVALIVFGAMMPKKEKAEEIEEEEDEEEEE